MHIAVSYDPGEGKHSFQPIDHTILKHKPCGPACDLQTTMRLWQALPDLVKQSVPTWVKETYNVKSSEWNLHSAIPVTNNAPRTRKLLQKLVLGTTARETAGGILLILASTERPYRSGSSTDSVRSASSSASDSPKPASKEDVKRLQAELAAMAAELKSLRAAAVDPVVGADAHMAPIRFKDAVGRKFNFAWHICKTWKGMESLIKQSFLHVDVIGSHVQEGHYDLMGPDGTIILPQLWETMIRPDWEVTMYMLPIPEPTRKDKKTKKSTPVIEPPVSYDPNGNPIIIQEASTGKSLQDPWAALDPSTSIAETKKSKKKGKKTEKSTAANPFLEPILEAHSLMQPVPPMASAPSQSRPVVGNFALEERLEEVDREDFKQRHSTRSTKNIVPASIETPVAYSYVEDSRIPTNGERDERTKDDVLDDGSAVPEDSDAEDAMLDDEALKNKMLMKYAGGVTALDASEPPVRRSQSVRLYGLMDGFIDAFSRPTDRVKISCTKLSTTSRARKRTDHDP